MFKNMLFFGLLSAALSSVASEVDPTKPFGISAGKQKSQVQKEALRLESIIHGAGIHTAVINGSVLKPGEYIGEYRLVAVNDQSVVLRSKTKRLKLHIFNSTVVK